MGVWEGIPAVGRCRAVWWCETSRRRQGPAGFFQVEQVGILPFGFNPPHKPFIYRSVKDV